MTEKYEPPNYNKEDFHCPHCGVYSHQLWHAIGVRDTLKENTSVYSTLPVSVVFCKRCKDFQVWVNQKMVYPKSSTAPLPSDDMPDDVKFDFNEARDICDSSPRAAAALLRLGLQKLMIYFGENGKDLNTDIGNLVKSNKLPVKIQQALDIIRVIGNESVHPGQIDIRDDPQTTIALFEMLNIIVDNMITQPKMIEKAFSNLPQSKKEQIEKRDLK
jgi:hypothetical protein